MLEFKENHKGYIGKILIEKNWITQFSQVVGKIAQSTSLDSDRFEENASKLK